MHFTKPEPNPRFTVTIRQGEHALRAEGYLAEGESIRDIAGSFNVAIAAQHPEVEGPLFQWKDVPSRAKGAVQQLAMVVAALCLLVTPAIADNYVTVDPLGHKQVLNEGGAVPSPEGTHFTFSPIDGDLELVMQGTSGTETEDPDKVLVGLSAMIFIARTTAIGLAVTRPDLANPDVLRLAPTIKHYIAVGAEDSWLKFVKLQPFSYSFPTGSDAGFTGSGLSADTRLTAGAEVPIGDKIAFQFEAGAIATFSSLGENVDTTVDPTAGMTIVLRLRPTPQ